MLVESASRTSCQNSKAVPTYTHIEDLTVSSSHTTFNLKSTDMKVYYKYKQNSGSFFN